MEPVWWEARAAKVSRAAEIVAAEADCSMDSALLLLKRRANAMRTDLEDIAVAVVTRRVRFHADPRPVDDYGNSVAVPRRIVSTETARCEWESDMEGQAWARTVRA
jgi:hypothetical protein